MQSSDRLTTAVNNAKTTIQEAAQNLWRACLAEAEASLGFANQMTGGSGPSGRTRQQRDEINARASAATNRTRGRTATTPTERVYNFIAGKNGIAADQIRVAGLPANTIGSVRTQLKKAGRIEERGGLWYATAANSGGQRTEGERAAA